MRQLAALACLTLFGCTDAQTVDFAQGKGEFSGTYEQRFEVSDFHPNGSDEHWWGIFPARLACMEGRHKVFLVVRGNITIKDRFGHFGRYDRELWVTEVVNCREVTDWERVFR